MVDEIYVKTLERDNERLREKLAETQLELDNLKDANKPHHTNLSDAGFGGPLQGGIAFKSYTDQQMTISPADFNITIGNSVLKPKDIDFLSETHKIMNEFNEASIWKKLKILWTMLVTKKTSKKE